MKLLFKVRTYTGGDPVAVVWLMHVEGISSYALMHGHMLEEKAKKLYKLFKSLGVPVERERSPLPGSKI